MKQTLKVIVGNKEFMFTFLQPPAIGNFIEDGEDFYEVMNVKHKAPVTRKPTDEEYESMTQFQITLIEVEPAEIIVYAKQHKKV